MTRQEERDMRLKIVKDALFWRWKLRELENSMTINFSLRMHYQGRLASSLYAIKVIKGIE